ncbi:fibrobacter succinogenes major paralogous domain-containing protein, partial [Bacteroides fragilis]
PNTTLSTTIRMVPFAGARTITVHFNTLTISGRTVPNNTEITSTGSVQLKEGKSYTMKIQFKKAIGINVPSGSINLTANGCSATDKTNLAKLTWADGNLKSTGSANYVWGTYSEYGYYYPWYKDYSGNNIDPCTRLKSDYGTGWRTPSRNECLSLSRCTDKAAVTSGGNKGMWFMNNSKGLFLPLAGARTWSGGSGTTATESGYARYWTSTNNSSSIAYSLNFENNKAEVNSSTKGDGFSVRCVK